jgi:hypothetical protein
VPASQPTARVYGRQHTILCRVRNCNQRKTMQSCTADKRRQTKDGRQKTADKRRQTKTADKRRQTKEDGRQRRRCLTNVSSRAAAAGGVQQRPCRCTAATRPASVLLPMQILIPITRNGIPYVFGFGDETHSCLHEWWRFSEGEVSFFGSGGKDSGKRSGSDYPPCGRPQ